MLLTPKTIIADTSCFIILTNIGELQLLQQVYGTITTTSEIALEFGHELPEWIAIEAVQDTRLQQLLEMQVDKGEASALALALEKAQCKVILDDYRARRAAERLGLDYTGTLGVIVRAKLEGIVTSVKPLLAKIKQTDFRISDAIEQQILREAGE